MPSRDGSLDDPGNFSSYPAVPRSDSRYFWQNPLFLLLKVILPGIWRSSPRPPGRGRKLPPTLDAVLEKISSQGIRSPAILILRSAAL
jgi:hypothetical protein